MVTWISELEQVTIECPGALPSLLVHAETPDSVIVFFRYYAYILFRESVISLFRDRINPLLAYSVTGLFRFYLKP